jgi:CheY-like chemotaxis protein
VNTTRNKRYWGTQRVARVCQVSPATVASWIDHGHLKGHKTPTGRRRVSSADLVEFLRSHGMNVPRDLLSAPRMAVVVVEDDPMFLRAMVRHLSSELDAEVIGAGSGMEGLLEIGRVQPAVVVLDYKLPDLNAAQVVQRLLSPERRSDAEILIVTGGLPSRATEELQQLGVRTILNKVDGLHAIAAAVQAALQRRKVA